LKVSPGFKTAAAYLKKFYSMYLFPSLSASYPIGAKGYRMYKLGIK